MSQKYNFEDTIIALATPSGVGAIGVIRLSGATAIERCNDIFLGKNLTKVSSHTIHLGKICDAEQNIIDEVLVSVFVAPRSYTKENVVEISCHGSAFIQQKIIQLLLDKGARLAQPGEFTKRAFLNGTLDLSQAEAVADLIASSSEASHRLAIQQMSGGISLEINQLRDKLIHFASLIELELDFGEEDVEFVDRPALSALIQKIRLLIGSLIQSFALGNAIKNGISTVIVGRPNAGKSTLLNALLNEERAIVSPIAGTTRDTIEETLNIGGVVFRLIDTAGIRAATDAIEALGVARTLEKARQSPLLIYVFDATQTTPDEVKKDLQQLYYEGIKIILVPNKTDLNPILPPTDYTNEWVKATQITTVSALRRQNIDGLKAKIYESAIAQQLHAASIIVSNARHYEALQNADESLAAAFFGLQSGTTTDFVAMDIRRALVYLGEIVGAVSTDDLLEKIFRDFCIGK